MCTTALCQNLLTTLDSLCRLVAGVHLKSSDMHKTAKILFLVFRLQPLQKCQLNLPYPKLLLALNSLCRLVTWVHLKWSDIQDHPLATNSCPTPVLLNVCSDALELSTCGAFVLVHVCCRYLQQRRGQELGFEGKDFRRDAGSEFGLFC